MWQPFSIVGEFDGELYLRLQGEEMLVGGRTRGLHPWDSPLVEVARALVAVGAIGATQATAVVDDYMFAGALRTEQGLEHRGSFGPNSRQRGRKAKPLEARRVVPCGETIKSPQGTLYVRHVALTESFASIAVTWRPTASKRRLSGRSRVFMYGGGHGGPPRATVVDDRGTRAGAHFSGGGSDDQWDGHFTTDQPLAQDTAWIEIDGTRVELGGEPSPWEVSIEPLPDQPPAHRYLWSRLATRSHFHELGSVDPVFDALIAAGGLQGDDPVIAEVSAVLEAIPHHPGMPSAGSASRQLPQPWRSMVTRAARDDGPEGTIALGAVTPVFDGFSVALGSIESRPEGFQIEVDVAPGLEGRGPFNWDVEPQRLAWWAADDRGNHYLGQIGSWSGGEDQSSGEIGFWPALHPEATVLRVMPTGEEHRAVITVPLRWAKRELTDAETIT